ncbi:phage gene 29 protein family protein [Corynebacterium pseudodiphtheriticum]|uniref:phage gene 29 protein family protein n=1 Tax=Corynebacterium pseudodiphtheriticum TaxID=37637 RepID=UPI002543C03C|nr:DUF2744 domain-containing protein [Corynebacterium pseudodiphtheriticum]MDK4206996.1 DUF2744 domain-containing protein [Corynebacterium pseudodiphtheriticum]
MALPSQEETDYSDPRQRFVWAFRGIEYNGMPFGAPEAVFREWSEHLSRCGFLHVDQVLEAARAAGDVGALQEALQDVQRIHYQPPVRGQDHPLNLSGKWVPVDEPIVDPEVPATSKMTPGEKAKLIEELREEGLISDSTEH